MFWSQNVVIIKRLFFSLFIWLSVLPFSVWPHGFSGLLFCNKSANVDEKIQLGKNRSRSAAEIFTPQTMAVKAWSGAYGRALISLPLIDDRRTAAETLWLQLSEEEAAEAISVVEGGLKYSCCLLNEIISVSFHRLVLTAGKMFTTTRNTFFRMDTAPSSHQHSREGQYRSYLVMKVQDKKYLKHTN